MVQRRIQHSQSKKWSARRIQRSCLTFQPSCWKGIGDCWDMWGRGDRAVHGIRQRFPGFSFETHGVVGHSGAQRQCKILLSMIWRQRSSRSTRNQVLSQRPEFGSSGSRNPSEGLAGTLNDWNITNEILLSRLMLSQANAVNREKKQVGSRERGCHSSKRKADEADGGATNL